MPLRHPDQPENIWNYEICNRPTKSGQPCNNRATKSDYIEHYFPCSTHLRDNHLKLESVLKEAYERGIKYGKERAEQEHAQWKNMVLSTREAERNIRTHDTQHRQLVKVGQWTYHWAGTIPLEVGEKIILPGSGGYYGTREWEATVTSIGSDYDEATKPVLRRVEPVLV